MEVAAFAAFWVILGLVLFFVAMSGGPGGAREKMHSQTKRARRVATVGFMIAVLGLVFGVPAAVIAVVKDREDVQNSTVQLTAAQEEGRELFARHCRYCHALAAANAYAEVGPNLDELKPPKELVLNAIDEGRSRGNGQMPADLAEGEEAEKLADFVATVAGR